MNLVQIRELAKGFGFNSLIETDSVIVVGNSKLERHSIIIAAATEKNVKHRLKKKSKPGKASETPNPPPPPPPPAVETTPLTHEKLESVNGIGPATAAAMVAEYPTEESLIANLTTGTTGYAQNIIDGLKTLFGL